MYPSLIGLPNPGIFYVYGVHNSTLCTVLYSPLYLSPDRQNFLVFSVCFCSALFFYLVHVAQVIFSIVAVSVICFPSGTSWT